MTPRTLLVGLARQRVEELKKRGPILDGPRAPKIGNRKKMVNVSGKGMPRWIRRNPDADERDLRCYGALLDELVRLANAATAKCGVCPSVSKCPVNDPPDGWTGGCPQN